MSNIVGITLCCNDCCSQNYVLKCKVTDVSRSVVNGKFSQTIITRAVRIFKLYGYRGIYKNG